MKETNDAQPDHVRLSDTFQDVLGRRIARRSFLKGALLTAPLLIVGSASLSRHLECFAKPTGRHAVGSRLHQQTID